MTNAAPQRPRVPRRVLDGVLLLDKPVGLSSNDALIRAKRLLLAKKAGHTGTLDPLASGLLPLCFGEATKFSQDLLDADKTYEATMRLGQRTATGDAEGDVIDTRPVECDRAAVEAALVRRFSFRRTGANLSRAQTENDEPHPQVVVAFGFLITNWAPLRSSL